MATVEQLEAGLKKAYDTGNMEYARVLGTALLRAREEAKTTAIIPGTQIPGTGRTTPEPSLTDRAIGAGETALAIGTGMTGGAVGMAGGMVKGLVQSVLDGTYGTKEAADAVERSAVEGAAALTYQPRTEQGQRQTEIVGRAAQNLVPLAGIAGEVGMAARGAQVATPLVDATARAAVAPVVSVAQRAGQGLRATVEPVVSPVVDAVRKMTGGNPNLKPGDLSAAATDIATQRQAQANELPVPFQMTKGQATRDFKQVQFEREAAKDPNVGEPLRKKFADDHAVAMQNFDAMIDQTGATMSQPHEIGTAVDKAIRSRAARDMAKIRDAYQKADAAGELTGKVDLQPVVDFLNANQAGVDSAPILKVTARQLKLQGAVTGSIEDGTLKMRRYGDAPEELNLPPIDGAPPSTIAEASARAAIDEAPNVKQVEQIRATINRFYKPNDPTDARMAAKIKEVIDQQTEGLGGDHYKTARAQRRDYAKNYEDHYLVSQLLGAKKGYADRAIAFEDVLKRTVLSPSASVDQVRHLGRLLKGFGPEGQQAWKEIQGGTIQHLRDQTFRSIAPDSEGNLIPSPKGLDDAMKQLDRGGKLEYLYGKAGAEKLRTLNDVMKDVMTAPPGAINHSNTAAVAAAMADTVLSGMMGLPLPVATVGKAAVRGIKNAKLRRRVEDALKPVEPK